MEVDVFGMGDMGRCWEPPFRHVHRPQGREFNPATAQIVAIEQVRRFRPGKHTCATVQSGAGEAIDVMLCEARISGLPGVAAIAAGEHRAAICPREDCATIRLDEEGVNMLIGQRPRGHMPTCATGITLDAHHPLNSADQHVLGRRRRTINRGSAMRQGYSHGCLLFRDMPFNCPTLRDPGRPGPYTYPIGVPASPATPD
jgi:hypothetical protein